MSVAHRVRSAIALIALLAGLSALTGCRTADTVETPSLATPDPPPSPVTYYIHTVKWQGETVSIIADWYTDDIENWKVLAEHNPTIDPFRIQTGMKIQIPEDILKRKRPLTKDFVDSYFGRKKKPQSPPPHRNEPGVFGPRNPLGPHTAP